jgi:GNAT superfamily N-acetyltransferase
MNEAAQTAIMIRLATADDARRVETIARYAYGHYVLRIGREPAPMLADYSAQIAAGNVVVIEVAGEICGYMTAWPEADAYFIDNIGVEPAWQGKGLGRRLIERAATEAIRHRLPALRLYTHVMMTENRSMYAHMGFVETTRVVDDGYDRIYMRRDLINC